MPRDVGKPTICAKWSPDNTCYAAAVKPTLCGLALLLLAAPAHAGRTHYGWLDGTEVVPERGVELETWVQDLDNVGPLERDETLLWWAVTVGVTDQLELALPLEVSWQRAGTVPGVTSLARWGAEARYRFVSSDPVEAPALVPLLRLAIKREVDERRAATVEAEVALSYERGCLHAQLNLGARQLLHAGEDPILVRPAAGVSLAVTEDLRVGAEAVASVSARGPGTTWLAAGPNLAWTFGRFWLAASVPVGVSKVDVAARVRWGIAF